MRRLLLGVVALTLAATPVLAQNDTRTIEPADYYRVQNVGSTTLSPDGRHLLYTVQTIRQEENDRITHVWWTDLETGRTQRLSTAGVNTSSPGWTPDGRRIYFRTTRGDESGIHFINFTEPGGEAYQIPGITSTPNYSPDGSWILIEDDVEVEGGGDDADEQEEEGDGQRAERQPWPDGIPGLTGPSNPATRGKTEAERNNDVYVITHSNYKRDGQLSFVPPGRGGFGGGDDDTESYTQFFRIPADGLPEGQEPVQLTFDEVDKDFEAFSPDGQWILYTVNLTELEEADEPEDEEEAEDEDEEEEMDEYGIYRVSSSGGQGELIVRVQGDIGSVRISPNNERLAFPIEVEDDTDEVLWIMDVSSGDRIAEVGADWRFGFGTPIWTPDSDEILWSTSIGGENQVLKVSADGGEIERVTDGRHVISSVSFDRNMTRMAYSKSTPERPSEAYIANIDGSGERQVSSVNDEWMSEVRLSRVEKFTYEGVPHNEDWLSQLKERGVEWMLANDAPDGERFEIDAWLMYPIDYEPGRRYPMVVSIHGGPHSRYSEGWFHEFQMLAAEGMFVLYTNPRGSGSYGQEFQYSTMEAWGIDDTKDILQAVDIVVDRGLADPDRLGITGGSYGGFMTNWITAHDQRWKAAITARSISNWISFYGVSDASGLVEREFGGQPWPFMDEEEGSYLLATMLSPIVWADRVETPTLIVHSINDYRTPLEGGEQWYRALQENDVEVKMVLFPDSSHGLSRGGEPWLLVRRLQEYVDWFSAHLVEDEGTTVADQAAAGS